MSSDTGVGRVCVDDCVLEQYANGFEVGVAGAEEEGFGGVEEGETKGPCRG